MDSRNHLLCHYFYQTQGAVKPLPERSPPLTFSQNHVIFDGVVKTSIYCVVCSVAILNILHV